VAGVEDLNLNIIDSNRVAQLQSVAVFDLTVLECFVDSKCLRCRMLLGARGEAVGMVGVCVGYENVPSFA